MKNVHLELLEYLFKGILRPIFYIDIDTHIDRKSKIMQNLLKKKKIFAECLSFY